MPFLSLANPRSRASLIAAFLLLEFMAILWLREFGPKDGADRAPLFNPRSQPPQSHQELQQEREEVLHLQVKKYRVSMKQEEGRDVEHAVVKSGRDAGGRLQGEKKTRDTGANGSKDQRPRGHQQQVEQDQKGRHPHRAPKPITVNNQSTSKRATERIKSKVSSLAAAAAASIPKARKVIKSNTHNKSTKSRKPANKAKHPNAVKNQRGGFKSTQERKEAQLIPVLDEHGATIEDHFISPRDSDGDGVPDYFVLLRPSSDNGKDMMDLGLFDEVVVAPVLAPAPAVAAVALPHVAPATVPSPIAPPQAPAAAPVVPLQSK
ncbi:hypothetical protein EC957_009728 [Mortierella hygrophila]|uniref:Uncharacterized protein n=1 Tax=Mortierella hygrophila TaxID=979708 RepID=A0A9P6EWT2_9FUNG|nr:hypothetical protein EC957_009728 [Mortierella hygrophila]